MVRLVDAVVTEATRNREQCQWTQDGIDVIEEASKASSDDMEVIKQRTGTLLEMSEDMITLTTKAGIETVDTPFINLMMNISSPIMVKGRQWGILRIMVKVK